jgi:DMSO/TMAO reductase YedYZ molybdopterin-dependent catalytic subunit
MESERASHSSRRGFLERLVVGCALLAVPVPQWAVAAAEVLDRLPGKRPLKRLTFRPPNYETPFEYLDEVITPNDAFFVRYHYAAIPELSAADWRLELAGDAAARPMSWSLDELRRGFAAAEVVAVCQCSGNRRGLLDPPVTGLHWSYGAMGNARWRGVRLRDLLQAANVSDKAVEVAFAAADAPFFETAPDFAKSLPRWKALHEDTLIAYEMNGEPLPHWNGFPARLVVPGWTATYWVKHLTQLDARLTPSDNYWVDTAYRVPDRTFPLIERFAGHDSGGRTPVTELPVNSLITWPLERARLKLLGPEQLRGICWDAGYGVERVEVSFDEGGTWSQARLGENLGRYSFRRWEYPLVGQKVGGLTVQVRATNRAGQTQTVRPIANPSGYQHNAIHQISVEIRA